VIEGDGGYVLATPFCPIALGDVAGGLAGVRFRNLLFSVIDDVWTKSFDFADVGLSYTFDFDTDGARDRGCWGLVVEGERTPEADIFLLVDEMIFGDEESGADTITELSTLSNRVSLLTTDVDNKFALLAVSWVSEDVDWVEPSLSRGEKERLFRGVANEGDVLVVVAGDGDLALTIDSIDLLLAEEIMFVWLAPLISVLGAETFRVVVSFGDDEVEDSTIDLRILDGDLGEEVVDEDPGAVKCPTAFPATWTFRGRSFGTVLVAEGEFVSTLIDEFILSDDKDFLEGDFVEVGWCADDLSSTFPFVVTPIGSGRFELGDLGVRIGFTTCSSREISFALFSDVGKVLSTPPSDFNDSEVLGFETALTEPTVGARPGLGDEYLGAFEDILGI
jgi:hypothetical protein